GHAVALVVLETVAGIEQPQSRHEPVTRDLGHDRGGRDRGEDRITADHGLAVASSVAAVTAVNEHELRPHRQACDGTCERPKRGPQNVVPVDPPRRRDGHRHLRAGANLGVQLLARLWIELLGIIKPARYAFGVEHDGGGDYRTGERSPARFVAARDRPHAALDRRAFAPKGRADLRFAQRQTHGTDLLGMSGDCARGGRAIHGAMVRAAAGKSTAAASALWRTGITEEAQNNFNCSAADRGGLKWSVVSR